MEPQNMPNGEVRRVSRDDIQLVQNLIERCLQLYMDQKEVVDYLSQLAKIEPGFTELVWQKLEEENREFFKAYHLRLMVKRQIEFFNKLLEEQVKLMARMQSTDVDSISHTNGPHMPSLQQNSACYATDSSSLPTQFANGGSSVHASNMHPAVDISSRFRRIDAPPNMIPSQGSSMEILQGMNGGGIIKAEDGSFTGASSFMFGADGNPTIADAPFGGLDSNTQHLNEPSLMDSGMASLGYNLGPFNRNFSLTDLTALSHNYDILESYPKSPYLTDTDDHLDSRERGLQGDNGRLDSISESLNYEGFGSN